MGLRETARADLERFLTDRSTGAGLSITLTAPDGTEYPLSGYGADISMTVDPQTGTLVSGRYAHVTLPTGPLLEATGDVWPDGVSDRAQRPWLVTMDDIHGVTWKFKVIYSMPDRMAGVVVLQLELYGDGGGS